MKLPSFFTTWFRKGTLEADMAEEMRLHLELETERNVAAGLSPEEARYAALRRFGGVEQIKEVAREQRAGVWMEQLVKDVRQAARSLANAPGFALTTILILVLGIGGVTAMFSTLYTVMIRPLPYPDASRLVLGRATYSGNINPAASGPDYLDYRDQSSSFSALGAFMSQPYDVSVSNGQSTERVSGLRVTSGLLEALGARMSQGRVFAEDEGNNSPAPVAIVSSELWKRHFGSASSLNGATVTVDGVARSVVGVLPPDFHFVHDADIWLPRSGPDLGPRRYNNWLLVGRLKPGVSLAEAQSDIDVIASRLEQTYPETNTTKALLLSPLQSALVEQYRSGFGILCGGAAAVLLVACANAAGLLLARGAGRRGELALRAALGASQGQIMRLLLVEALLLAGAAATLGTLLSLWIQNVLMRLFSVETLFVHDQGVSWPVLGFALGLAVLTGVGFGMLPAWRARRPDLMQALKGTGKGSSRSGSRLRGALVAAQIGVSFVLLTVAGLLSRSLISLYQSDPGFDPRNLLTVEVPLPPRDYNGPRRTAFFESLLGQIRAAPGVQSAGAISQLPLRNPGNDISVYDASRPPTQPSERGNGYQRVVLPGYFQAMGIPLLAGRDVRSSDTQGVARVVVISRTLASRLFGESDPLGRKIIVDGAANEPWEVVGLVADVKATDLSEAATSRGAFYRPHAQLPINIMRIAVRTEVPPESLVGDLRSIVRKLDPHVPLAGPRTMEQLMDNVTVSQKAQTIFLTTFSLLAMVLAAVGIHGLLAYRVRLQQREIGIRMALGADPKHVAWGVLREAGLLTLFGALGGILGALAVSQLLRSSLHGIGPFDPFVLATAALVLVILAIGAAWFPARRAIRVNPAHVLSAE